MRLSCNGSEHKLLSLSWHTIFEEVLLFSLIETGNLKPWPRPDHPDRAEKRGAQKEHWRRHNGQIQSHSPSRKRYEPEARAGLELVTP